MLDEEIVRVWGEGSLMRWLPELLAKTTLPEDAKVFLARVGMPNGADWSARFDWAGKRVGDRKVILSLVLRSKFGA